MSNGRKVKEALRDIIGMGPGASSGSGAAGLFLAEVVKVTGKTCTVKIGTLELSDVRLTAIKDDSPEEEPEETPEEDLEEGSDEGSEEEPEEGSGENLEETPEEGKDEDPNDIVITPAVGSIVMVGDLSGGELRNLAVIQYSKIDHIKFNGGDLGGMAVVSKMVTWMNSLRTDIENLITDFSEYKVLIPAPGQPTQPAPLGFTYTLETQPADAIDFENPKIQH